MSVKFDTKEFEAKLNKLIVAVPKSSLEGTRDVATEVLRLSMFEVPHDIGLLQASGVVDPQADETIVGYNKVYAARLHEHPEYRFQKGRKGKYLEDPIKNNIQTFITFLGRAVQGGMR